MIWGVRRSAHAASSAPDHEGRATSPHGEDNHVRPPPHRGSGPGVPAFGGDAQVEGLRKVDGLTEGPVLLIEVGAGAWIRYGVERRTGDLGITVDQQVVRDFHARVTT